MNYKELAEKTGIRYDTVRNYARVLLEEGLVSEIDEKAVDIAKRIPAYTAAGLTVKEAALKAVEDSRSETAGSEEISLLKQRIVELEGENESLKAELKKERDLINNLRTKLESLSDNEEEPEEATGLALYREEATTAADVLKGVLKSVGNGFTQFMRWLFDTEKTDEDQVSKVEEREE
jgi:predicted RNase H-like nuclease (RuvC/YqgF family)